jgi:hypothetical protein
MICGDGSRVIWAKGDGKVIYIAWPHKARSFLENRSAMTLLLHLFSMNIEIYWSHHVQWRGTRQMLLHLLQCDGLE